MAQKSLRRTLLEKSKEAIEKSKIPFRINKDKNALKGWIIDKEEEEADLQLKLEDAKSAKTLNIDGILDTIDELEIVQRRLKQAKELEETLFGEIVEE